MTGAPVKDMILNQDLTKLLLVFYISFHFIVYLKKPKQQQQQQESHFRV